MPGKILLSATIFVVSLMTFASNATRTAFACTKTTGCIYDTFRESYDMMHNGQMNQAMIAGKENIAAFKRLEAAEKQSTLSSRIK